jgi:hypothetical protein
VKVGSDPATIFDKKPVERCGCKFRAVDIVNRSTWNLFHLYAKIVKNPDNRTPGLKILGFPLGSGMIEIGLPAHEGLLSVAAKWMIESDDDRK